MEFLIILFLKFCFSLMSTVFLVDLFRKELKNSLFNYIKDIIVFLMFIILLIFFSYVAIINLIIYVLYKKIKK